jgi:hypothetical protein
MLLGGNTMNTNVPGITTTIALTLLVSVGFSSRLGAEEAEFRAKNLPYPDVTDTSHATDRVADIFEGFFTAKSEHDGVRMLTFFAPDPVLYIDAGLGFAWPSRAALLAVWTNPPFSNGPPNALSYPLRVIGDTHSALIEFEDTPALLGSEFRFLSSITFNNRAQIVRWIDYWDGRSSQVKIPIGTLGPYPVDFNDNVVNASARIKQVSQALQDAFAVGNAVAAAQLFTTDAIYEDMALHTRVEGQIQIQRYLTRGLNQLPYGVGASLAHVVGSDQGGGFEWHAAPSAAPLQRGNTAIELDDHGGITRFTTIYDSYQFPDAQYQALVLLGAEQ